MKIPKYIDKALTLRRKYALLLDNQCKIIDKFIEKHGIECESEDYLGGVEVYVHPVESEQSVRMAIAVTEKRIYKENL